MHAVFSTKDRRPFLRPEEELRETNVIFGLGIMTGTRPPFQGDSLGDVFPGLKPMGYSVFALRAMPNVQTPGAEGAKRLEPTPQGLRRGQVIRLYQMLD